MTISKRRATEAREASCGIAMPRVPLADAFALVPLSLVPLSLVPLALVPPSALRPQQNKNSFPTTCDAPLAVLPSLSTRIDATCNQSTRSLSHRRRVNEAATPGRLAPRMRRRPLQPSTLAYTTPCPYIQTTRSLPNVLRWLHHYRCYQRRWSDRLNHRQDVSRTPFSTMDTMPDFFPLNAPV